MDSYFEKKCIPHHCLHQNKVNSHHNSQAILQLATINNYITDNYLIVYHQQVLVLPKRTKSTF